MHRHSVGTITLNRIFTYIVACSLLACTLNDSDPVLKQSIESKMLDSLSVLDFGEETDFDWDEMIILGPYSSHERVEAEHHVELTRSKNSPIQSFDHYNLVVFLKDKKEVAYVELNREADFEKEQTLIPRNDAVFNLQGRTMKAVKE